MTRILITLLLALLPTVVSAQITPVYLGYYEVHIDGNDTTYMQGLALRKVDGDMRMLSIAFSAKRLVEYRLPALGQRQTQIVRSWALPNGAYNDFTGIWYEQAKNRIWITSTQDYTAENRTARVITGTLGTSAITDVRTTTLSGVAQKKVYGGCGAVPSSLVAQIGGPYVCGWGGYTSLVEQGGGAAIGPTMYAIPDPATSGSTVTPKKVLETAPASQQRGVRKTIPVNYFDGGDPRQNPSTRPTSPPVSSGNWLSPNAQGLGWMTWGDSYYNTGNWVGEYFVAVASLCKGACWYQNSTLAYDGRQFELHIWDGRKLGANLLQRPDQMIELTPPRRNVVWFGNAPAMNMGAATYDPETRTLYILSTGAGPNDYIARIYAYRLDGVASQPPPVPTDAVVSDWSAWSAIGAWSPCVPSEAGTGGVQTRTEERTRTVITPAAHGGSTPPLRETRIVTRACALPTPGPDPEPEPIPDLDALIRAAVERVLATWPRPQDGAPGAPGPAGPQGPQGPKGDKGDTGEPGASVTIDDVRSLIRAEIDRIIAALREAL